MRISPNTTNIWKNLHKTAFIKDLTNVNIKFDNHFDFFIILTNYLYLKKNLYLQSVKTTFLNPDLLIL